MPHQIMLCTNDPVSGADRGVCCHVYVAGLELLYYAAFGGSRWRNDEAGQRFKLGYWWTPYRSHRDWVGNWCWRAFTVSAPQTCSLLNRLRNSDRWDCTSGPDGLFEQWMARRPFTPQDLVG